MLPWSALAWVVALATSRQSCVTVFASSLNCVWKSRRKNPTTANRMDNRVSRIEFAASRISVAVIVFRLFLFPSSASLAARLSVLAVVVDGQILVRKKAVWGNGMVLCGIGWF